MDNENYAFETGEDMLNHIKQFRDMGFGDWIRRFGQTPSQANPRMGMTPGMDEYRAQERNPLPKSPSGGGGGLYEGPIAALGNPEFMGDPTGGEPGDQFDKIIQMSQNRNNMLEAMREAAPGKYASSGMSEPVAPSPTRPQVPRPPVAGPPTPSGPPMTSRGPAIGPFPQGVPHRQAPVPQMGMDRNPVQGSAMPSPKVNMEGYMDPYQQMMRDILLKLTGGGYKPPQSTTPPPSMGMTGGQNVLKQLYGQ